VKRKGVDLKAAASADRRGRTPLHRAAAADAGSAELCTALVDCCVIGARDAEGRTALQVAQQWGLPEAAAVLLEASGTRRVEVKAAAAAAAEAAAKAYRQDIGHTAGFSAIHDGRLEDLAALLDNMDWRFVNEKDSKDRTVFHYIALRGHAELCAKLLERPDFQGCDLADKERSTALHLAAGNRHAGCVRAIIDSGRLTSINARDLNNRTALHLAALRADKECYEAIAAHEDCSPEIPDRSGRSAAEYAAERGMAVELPKLPQLDEIEL